VKWELGFYSLHTEVGTTSEHLVSITTKLTDPRVPTVKYTRVSSDVLKTPKQPREASGDIKGVGP
jgi:hypothetical protein